MCFISVHFIYTRSRYVINMYLIYIKYSKYAYRYTYSLYIAAIASWCSVITAMEFTDNSVYWLKKKSQNPNEKNLSLLYK